MKAGEGGEEGGGRGREVGDRGGGGELGKKEGMSEAEEKLRKYIGGK